MRNYRGANLNVIWFLMAVNVLVFIVTVVSPDVIFLLGLQPATLFHHPWTMISNLFVHGGISHIFANMISLYFLGSFVLRLVGEKRFLIVYFLGGIVGNLFFLLLADPFSIGIGASGAIFALGGILVIMAPKLPVFIFFIPVPMPLWVAIIIFLLISFMPGIAWQAHLGGFILGLIAGQYFKRKRTHFH